MNVDSTAQTWISGKLHEEDKDQEAHTKDTKNRSSLFRGTIPAQSEFCFTWYLSQEVLGRAFHPSIFQLFHGSHTQLIICKKKHIVKRPHTSPKRLWRRVYSSSASKNWALRKSGQSVGVPTSSA